MNWKLLPNIITSIRLLLLIPLAFYLSSQNYQPALMIFFIAGFSDAVDGFLAKKFGWVSRLGSILDPVADKALLVLTFAILALNGKISVLLFSVAAVRDIYIVLGAYFYYRNIGPFQMEPSYLSKFNTFAQILLVVMVLVSLSYYPMPDNYVVSLTWLVYATIVSSSVHYSWVWIKKYRVAKQSKLNNSTG
jgi:cardiolipin synthase (CMP-forming)